MGVGCSGCSGTPCRPRQTNEIEFEKLGFPAETYDPDAAGFQEEESCPTSTPAIPSGTSCQRLNEMSSVGSDGVAPRGSGRGDAPNSADAGTVAGASTCGTERRQLLCARAYRPRPAGEAEALADLAARVVRSVISDRSGGEKSGAGDNSGKVGLTDRQVGHLIAELEFTVDCQYDVLLAELLLIGMEEQLDPKECARILERAEVLPRLLRKFGFLETISEVCSSNAMTWFNVYKVGDLQTIDVSIDKNDASVLHYKARLVIPAPLSTAMVVANEVDMIPEWNKLVVSPPKTMGRRTAHYMCLNYHMSIMGGMYKIDLLNEIRRFSDTSGGILVELIRSIQPGHPCFHEPKKGFRRPKSELKNIWVACGPNTSIFIQVGRIQLPFSATKWVASTVGSIAGRFILGGLLNNSMRAVEPGNPWEKRLEADSFRFYQRLRELTQSEASCARAPAEEGKAPKFSESDLQPVFSRRFQRCRAVREAFAAGGLLAAPPLCRGDVASAGGRAAAGGSAVAGAKGEKDCTEGFVREFSFSDMRDYEQKVVAVH